MLASRQLVSVSKRASLQQRNTGALLARAFASAPAQCDVVLVGCGVPSRGMGWYHAKQLIEGLCPSARLTDVVEPWFLGGGASGPGGGEFAAWAKETEAAGVRFHSSMAGLPRGGSSHKMALISGRTADNPRLLTESIAAGCSHIYLEKPGAPTVGELEAMAAEAAAANVGVYMGYNKNVTKYVTLAREFEAKTPGATTTFVHNNAVPPAELPECFGRNSEGMLKNMAVHELAILVTYYGVAADTIAEVVVDKEYSKCETLTFEGTEYTDFSKIGFTITTKAGKTVTVKADRCGGSCSEAVVSVGGAAAFTAVTPDAELEAEVAVLSAKFPDYMPYFHLQADDYITLKERSAKHILSGAPGAPEGLADIAVAIETLKVAEYLTPYLRKELMP